MSGRSFFLMLMLIWGGDAAVAQDADGMRIVQARADGKRIQAWLDVPNAPSLDADQFSATVGSRPATVTAIDAPGTVGDGVAYIFVVDISKSLTAGQFGQIQDGLRNWVQGLGPRDRVAILTVGRAVVKRTDFTDDSARLLTIVDGLAQVDLETSFYQGVLDAIELGRRRDDDLPVRRAIVVLSDGIDDSLTGATQDEVIRRNREFQLPIYTIGFASPPITEGKRQGLKSLSMLARQSGGYFVQAEPGAVAVAVRSQLERILNAYRISLECPDCAVDGGWVRFNLTGKVGQRVLNDGLDLRLVSDVPGEPRNRPLSDADKPSSYLGGMALIVLAFLAFRAWLAWDRLRPTGRGAIDMAPAESVGAMAPVESEAIQWVVVAGAERGRVYRMPMQAKSLIGRAPECDLTIADDLEVSARHAVLMNDAAGFKIRDLHSTNGTLVNGVPVHNDFPIRDGDLVLFGRTELRIKLPAGR